MPSFSQTLYKEFLSPLLLIGTICIALLYLTLSVFLLNMRLFGFLFLTHTSFATFFSLFLSLLAGLSTSMSSLDFILSITSALLVGLNGMLIFRTLYFLEHSGKVRLSIGGATVFGIIATGCTSCGLSLLSILGLSTSLAFLPFHGLEIHVGSLMLLCISAFYMLSKIHTSMYCKINKK